MQNKRPPAKHHFADKDGNVHHWEDRATDGQTLLIHKKRQQLDHWTDHIDCQDDQKNEDFIPIEPSGPIIASLRNKRGYSHFESLDEETQDKVAPSTVTRNVIMDIEEETDDGTEMSPRAKRSRIEIADYEADEMNRSGNVLGHEVKWVKLKQEDSDFFTDPPATQAMWLVMEQDSYNDQIWYRPAIQMSEVLEAQYKANQGFQVIDISYKRDDETKVTNTYEHDMRGEEWVQRRIEKKEDGSRVVRTSKKVVRVVLK